jgi:hypothetical protein
MSGLKESAKHDFGVHQISRTTQTDKVYPHLFSSSAWSVRLLVLNAIQGLGLPNQAAITNHDFRITNNRPKIKEQGNVAALLGDKKGDA